MKRLGAFGERGLELTLIRGIRGARNTIHNLAACELLFVMEGVLRASNSQDWIGKHSAVRIDASDSGMSLEVDQDATMFAITLPLFG